jgi:hypothetical protein
MLVQGTCVGRWMLAVLQHVFCMYVTTLVCECSSSLLYYHSWYIFVLLLHMRCTIVSRKGLLVVGIVCILLIERFVD